MSTQMAGERIGESIAMMMIGDGVLGAWRPAEHCMVWRGGPRWWNAMIDWFSAHPTLTRAAALAEVGAGVWLARRSQLAGSSLEAGARVE